MSEVFKDWLSPMAAIEVLKRGFGGDAYAARRILIRALHNGIVAAIAQTTTIDGGKPQKVSTIPKEHWEDVRTDDLIWDTGHWSYQFRDPNNYGYHPFNQYSRFSVRFNPDDLKTLLPPSAAEPAPTESEPAPTSPGPVDPEVERTKPISPADLKAWYEVYKGVYPDQSEDHAWASALGMFRDRQITRKMIRDLRGPREMGRPKAKQ